jgi:hypothetical protein
VGLSPPPSSGGGTSTPAWTIDLDGFNVVGAFVGTVTPNFDSLCFYGGYLQSGGTQNEQFDWPVMLAAGTWTIVLMCTQSSSGGIATLRLDDGAGNFSTVGTADLYNAGLARNVGFSFTGVSVAATGKKTLRVLMATKNASSSNYYLFLQHIALLRTA